MLNSLCDTKYVSNLQKGSMFPQKPHETIFRLYWQSNGRKASTWMNLALGINTQLSCCSAAEQSTTTSCPHVSWSCWARSIPRRWRWVTFELVTGWSLTHVQGLAHTHTHTHFLCFGLFSALSLFLFLPFSSCLFSLILIHLESRRFEACEAARLLSVCVCTRVPVSVRTNEIAFPYKVRTFYLVLRLFQIFKKLFMVPTW